MRIIILGVKNVGSVPRLSGRMRLCLSTVKRMEPNVPNPSIMALKTYVWGTFGRRRGAVAMPTVFILVACAALIAACAPFGSSLAERTPSVSGELVEGRVTEVTDGDSIKVDGRSIRLIGVNAPEFGRPNAGPSRDALLQLLEGGSVRLEHDIEVRDQFGRELAYVFLDDGRHVNVEMLRAGFAQAYTIPPNLAHNDELRNAEREARDAGRGLWLPSDLPIDITEIEFDPVGPDGDDLNGEWVQLVNRGESAVQLKGLVLSDESNNAFELLKRELVAGGALRVHSGTGRPSGDAIYWGRDVPLWNNDGDSAFLRDGDGLLIDRFSYGSGR